MLTRIDGEVMGGTLSEGDDTGEDWGYCAQLLSCADIGDGILVNFVKWTPLLS